MELLVFYFLIAVLVSFACSLLESVLLSITPAYIAVAIKNDHRSGRLMKKIKGEINRPLAAILTLNTLANMAGAAGVGAQTMKIYGDDFVAVASGVLTLAILVFSEIIPKTIGAIYWKKIAPQCVYIISWLIFLSYPFVILSELITDFLTRKKQKQITRAEMIETAELGVSEGTLRKKESAIIKNLLMLDNIFVKDIMTPRSVVFALNGEDTVKHVIEKHHPIRYSRIPVYKGSLDKISGMVHRYKVLEASSQDKHNMKVSSLIKPIQKVAEDVSVSTILDSFVRKSEHVFLVVDGFDSVTGIVTLEDAIETLLGVEIVDEFDSVADLRQHAIEMFKNRRPSSLKKGSTGTPQGTPTSG